MVKVAFKFLKILTIHDIFVKIRELFFVLFYDVHKENMFTFKIKDGQEAPWKASTSKLTWDVFNFHKSAKFKTQPVFDGSLDRKYTSERNKRFNIMGLYRFFKFEKVRHPNFEIEFIFDQTKLLRVLLWIGHWHICMEGHSKLRLQSL